VVAIALAAVASLIGDTFWYWLGRTRGPRVMSWLCRMSLEPDSCVRRTQGVFDRWGARALVVAKFVPGLSTIAPPLAGVVRMPLQQFVVFSALAGAVWGGAYLTLGWIFSAQLEEDMIVVDVRDRGDFQAEPAIIPGALHMTVDELDRRHREIPRERDIVLYCTCPSEATSARAALLLRKRGIERIRPLAGGYHGWRDLGYPMTRLATTTSAAPATTLAMAAQGGSNA
jgi:rhodanese-related sulfurtransferase